MSWLSNHVIEKSAFSSVLIGDVCKFKAYIRFMGSVRITLLGIKSISSSESRMS